MESWEKAEAMELSGECLEDEMEVHGRGEGEDPKGGEEQPGIGDLVDYRELTLAPTKAYKLRGEPLDRDGKRQNVLVV